MAEDSSPAVQRVLDFVNTYDVESGTDMVDTPAKLGAWLVSQRWLDEDARVTADDVTHAARLRETLRAALLARVDTGSAASAAAAYSVPLELHIAADGTVGLAPTGSGVARALGLIVAPIPAAVADRTWSRVKACANDTCHWAFYDRSKNRSRRWCSMEVCGNREKTQAFRVRHRRD